MKQIEIKSRWSSNVHKFFVVTDVKTTEQGTWIHYQSLDTGNDYNCLVDAFLQRFTKELNS